MKNRDEKRGAEITRQYLDLLDRHIDDVISGSVPEFMKLNEIARELAISHKHLTHIVQKEKGHHPCYFYDAKIIDKAKYLLAGTDMAIAKIATTLTYDASNFSKFFKKWTGETPGMFRTAAQKKQ
ncbi:AraC family transcriptional regulator [Chitinophaga parva]|uniref:AraC family transcriptional regulator n=1 Tax=Chitinophaga parva TaxID=2169414 RepID=A0A2T7BGA3_9BACT|nr:AraC family transcriptional regulator [Chitinophaga parva]PUZ25316.1 AraC family transcriptional regulator [Chitinophaga parva]